MQKLSLHLMNPIMNCQFQLQINRIVKTIFKMNRILKGKNRKKQWIYIMYELNTLNRIISLYTECIVHSQIIQKEQVYPLVSLHNSCQISYNFRKSYVIFYYLLQRDLNNNRPVIKFFYYYLLCKYYLQFHLIIFPSQLLNQFHVIIGQNHLLNYENNDSKLDFQLIKSKEVLFFKSKQTINQSLMKQFAYKNRFIIQIRNKPSYLLFNFLNCVKQILNLSGFQNMKPYIYHESSRQTQKMAIKIIGMMIITCIIMFEFIFFSRIVEYCYRNSKNDSKMYQVIFHLNISYFC
ncbi:unnamed protein product [Paramecium octaurelia]|uniref:Transmembrane protein n=1 Tax=Paramecium octaurelia TaxID=43137 RepID=A0A8S1WFP0_PAROT|nr:unnamed protein product [Paramecium octaurelia]